MGDLRVSHFLLYLELRKGRPRWSPKPVDRISRGFRAGPSHFSVSFLSVSSPYHFSASRFSVSDFIVSHLFVSCFFGTFFFRPQCRHKMEFATSPLAGGSHRLLEQSAC